MMRKMMLLPLVLLLGCAKKPAKLDVSNYTIEIPLQCITQIKANPPACTEIAPNRAACDHLIVNFDCVNAVKHEK